MVNKLNEIATKESMELPINILNTIIDVSNGDMRKAIMMLQNLKYLYDFKAGMNKSISTMNMKELKLVHNFAVGSSGPAMGITENDIYDIAASIPMSKAHEYISEVFTCKSIVDVTMLSRRIISRGYPIDNVLVQLNKAVLETDDLNDEQKALVVNYSGKIFLRMKECANEYIQLSDYLASVYGIVRGVKAYTNEMCV